MKKYLIYATAAFFATMLVAVATPESDIEAKEKATWQAYKDKKADDFKKLLSPDLVAVYADGQKTLQDELNSMAKMDMKSVAFSNIKVTMADANTATIAYQVKLSGSMEGHDISGDYNVASVWVMKNGEWRGIFHTDVKAEAPPTTEAKAAQKKE